MTWVCCPDISKCRETTAAMTGALARSPGAGGGASSRGGPTSTSSLNVQTPKRLQVVTLVGHSAVHRAESVCLIHPMDLGVRRRQPIKRGVGHPCQATGRYTTRDLK